MYAGDGDMGRAVAELRARIPDPLAPLAAAAFNYRWAWDPDGAAVFETIDPSRWERCGHNPVRLLAEARLADLARASEDGSLVDRANALVDRLGADLARPTPRGWPVSAEHPAAFLCAEYAIHHSLPIYSGGLGVLAGDILKEASDLALPMVAVGLMYRTGYFHQRVDDTGAQHEYWIDTDPERLPAVRVRAADGTPLRFTVPVDDEGLVVSVWRVDVGRVPLYLLDTDLPENSTFGRWVTSRLYEQNRSVRLAQYAVLGVGGVLALQAMGIEPSVHHLNEGHPALAAAALVARRVSAGVPSPEAWQSIRDDVVFTTHTPVEAGNETYDRSEILEMLAQVGRTTGDVERFLSIGRIDESDASLPSGMTTLALRTSRSVNGVSRRHGEVARAMWQPVFAAPTPEAVPITHVTNGVHVPTWLAEPMRELLDRHLPDGWRRVADDPDTWAAVDDIGDAELWATRCELRRRMLEVASARATADRLRRGEDLDYARSLEDLDPERLTIGFARRLATYKRLYLLGLDPERALKLLDGVHPVQLLFAGKAHPADQGAKEIVKRLFELKDRPRVSGRVVFLEDYDLPLAAQLVAGCDVWVNVPRPPLEASGTSGMKSVLNGGLQLSVLDGWWAEAYDGTNGWAVDGEVDADESAQDLRHAAELFDRLEREIIPMFWRRDADGLPTEWLARIRASLRTNGPRFSATRMVREYATRIYPR